MPQFDAEAQSQLEERRGTWSTVLMWIMAKERATGALQPIGLWSGDDHQEFIVDGEIRLYYGAGNVIDVPPVIATPGFSVRNYRITVPPFTDEVKALMHTYDVRLAPTEVHVCPLDIDSGNPLSRPKRIFKGFLNEAPEEIAPKGGKSRTQLVLVSAARRLTFGLPLKRSSFELQRRNPSDKGRIYSDVAGEWVVPWGTS
jgi:hypothetical protein